MKGWNNPRFKKQAALGGYDSDLVIDNISIFDGTGKDAYKNGRIVIKGGKIFAIGLKEEVELAEANHIVDGRGMMALPGLIDAHVHLSWNGVFEPYPPFFGEDLGNRLTRNAWLTLKSGVTTVREMPGFGGVKLKQSIEKGNVAGPRIVASTSALTVKGGYFGYPFWGTTVKDSRKVPAIIEQKIKKGCDFIKTVSPYSDPLRKEKNISLDLLSTIVREANKRGLAVAAHTMWADGLETAIDAGVTSLEHCPPYVGGAVPDEILMKARGKEIYFVPTVDLLRRNYLIFNDRERILEEKAYHKNIPGKSLRKMLKMADKVKVMQEKKPEIKAALNQLFKGYQEDYAVNFRKALEYGIKIAAGTDSGSNYTPHGIIAKELELYVRFGMTTKEAILSATMVGAELLGLEKEIGSIEPGKQADLVLTEGNPLEDITDLQNVRVVIKDGQPRDLRYL